MKRRLLFIDHVMHQATQSARFFVDVLRGAFDVVEKGYERYYRVEADEAMREADVAVVWEFPIGRRRFYYAGKVNVFVPMYDNEWGSVWQWKRIAASQMGVISFCEKVSAHARRCGVRNLLEVKYFPNPRELPQREGERKKVFLWERGGVSKEDARKMFPEEEGYQLVVKRADEFLPRGEYLEKLAECGIVIAPRRKEGIGMAFLEAMAMGKCVVAHNDATMNEYIVDGENGLLIDFDQVERIGFERVEAVRRKSAAFNEKYYARWCADKEKIAPFVDSLGPCCPGVWARLKMVFEYPIYLVEGLLWRVCNG